MAEHSTLISDSDGNRLFKLAFRRWQHLDRGWKAGLFGLAIVVVHLAGVWP